jgi:hypothetical protein
MSISFTVLASMHGAMIPSEDLNFNYTIFLSTNNNNNQELRNEHKIIEIESKVENVVSEKTLNAEKEDNYWKWNLKVTLLPLFLCGIPIYLFSINDGGGKGVPVSS